MILGTSARGVIAIKIELASISNEATLSVPKTDQCALRNGMRATWIFGDQRMQHLAIPRGRMLNVENGV